MAFAPDGQTLVSGGGDAAGPAVGRQLRRGAHGTLLGHFGRVTAVAFSPDGKTLATAGDDRTVKLWVVVWEKR